MSEAMFWFLFGAGVVLAAVVLRRRFFEFAGQRVDDYGDGHPPFDLRRHLAGRLICEGAIFGPAGRVTSTFIAYFDAKWTGNVGVIDEEFLYDDGEKQQRQWTITLAEDGTFTAKAPDVPGIGKGAQTGAAVLLRYPIRIPERGGGYVLKAFDCMYLTEEGTIINRSQFRKFGIRVAELVASIRPVTAP